MGIESKGGWRQLGAVCAVLILGISLLVPALINRQPVLYSDSVGYFHAGYAALQQLEPRRHADAKAAMVQEGESGLARQEKDGISTARSVYYGLPYVLTYLAGGIWAPIAGPVLLTLACLLLVARRAIALNAWARLGTLLGISLLSGLSFFADTIMPDVFAGLMLLAAGMLLAYGKKIPDWERAFWLLIVLLACLFHKSHLVILVLMLLTTGLFLWREHRKELALLFATAVLGFAAHAAVDFIVQRLTGAPPITTPFLLARMIGDGTAEKYLSQTCPVRHFATCEYLDRMPMTENEFLWSRDPKKSVMGTADRKTRAAIAAESGEIVRATVFAFPAQQLLATAKNIFKQFTTVGVTEFGLVPNDERESIAVLRPAMERYRTSAIADGKAMPLGAISIVMLAMYLVSLAGSAWLLVCRAADRSPARRFAIILLLGIGANAIVCGAISGVFDRYQGRVAWLAMLALAALLTTAFYPGSRPPKMAPPGNVR